MNHRLLQIVPSLRLSGTATQVTLLTEQLSQQGIRSGVLSLGGPGPLADRLQAAGARVEWLDPGTHRLGATINRVRRWLRSSAPDIIHTWGKSANLYGRLAATTTSAKVIASYRSLATDHSLLEDTLDRQLARWSKSLIVNSQPLLAHCEQLGLPASKLHCIPNGVKIATPASAAERRQLRDAAAIPAGAKVIGAVGPLVTGKRVKDVIWATDLLKNVRDDAYLVILGDGPHRWRLERFCRQVQIGDRVRFLGDCNKHDRAIASLDLLFHAGRGDSVPNAVLEAMASQVPVVASDTEAHRQLVQHDQTGCLVAVGDRAGFARQAIRVLDDSVFADQLRSNALEHLNRHHDLQAMVDSHLNLYRRAVMTSKHESRDSLLERSSA